MRQIESITEIHQLLAKCLNHFATFCNANNLRFYLSNGTLLGAVKYKGFIPWDDDVDVMMPRSDYDQLMELSEIDRDGYRLLARERIPNWSMPYAKLSVESTLLQETSADFGVPCGISIDIFPLDNWPGYYPAAVLQAFYLSLLRRGLSASVERTFFTLRTGITRTILLLIWKFSRAMGTPFFLSLIDKQVERGRKREQSPYVGCIAWAAYGTGEILPSNIFDKTVKLSFGGVEYPAPAGCDVYLRRHYGNYKMDPPISKQKSNHTITLWDKSDE